MWSDGDLGVKGVEGSEEVGDVALHEGKVDNHGWGLKWSEC